MVKSLKSKKKKLALTLFDYFGPEICLGSSKKLICNILQFLTPVRIQTELQNI